MPSSASATRRDLPTPASPTTVTSSQDACVSARSHACSSADSSCARPTKRDACERSGGPGTASSRNAGTGSAFPFNASGSTASTTTALLHERERRLADQHLARLGRLLQPRRDVDGVTRRQPLLGARHDLAGVDADPAVDAELRERVPHLHRGPARAQRVVLVRRRHPEHGHHRVADELLDRAAVPLDDRLHPLEVARQQSAQRLRIRPLAQRRRTGDVAEEHRDDLANFPRRSSGLQRTAALRAEPGGGVRLVPATHAGRHVRSLSASDQKVDGLAKRVPNRVPKHPNPRQLKRS